MIYWEVYSHAPRLSISTRIDTQRYISTGLLLTNRQISREAKEALISSSEWSIMTNQFQDIVTLLGKDHFSLIRELTLRVLPTYLLDEAADHSDPCQEAERVIKSMPHLRAVRLIGGEVIVPTAFSLWLPNHHPDRIREIRDSVQFWTERLLLFAIDIIEGKHADLQKVVCSPTSYEHEVDISLLSSYLPVRAGLGVSDLILIPIHLFID